MANARAKDAAQRFELGSDQVDDADVRRTPQQNNSLERKKRIPYAR